MKRFISFPIWVLLIYSKLSQCSESVSSYSQIDPYEAHPVYRPNPIQFPQSQQQPQYHPQFNNQQDISNFQNQHGGNSNQPQQQPQQPQLPQQPHQSQFPQQPHQPQPPQQQQQQQLPQQPSGTSEPDPVGPVILPLPTSELKVDPLFIAPNTKDTLGFYSIYDEEFWLLVQQSLVIGLLVLSIIYAFYVLILPLSVGGRSFDSKGLEVLSLDSLMDNRITQVFGSVLKSLDPVDLTFGVLNVGDEDCKKRTVCQLKKTVGLMSFVDNIFNNYIVPLPGMKKYHEAIEASKSSKTCSQTYSKCEKETMQFLPRFLRGK